MPNSGTIEELLSPAELLAARRVKLSGGMDEPDWSEGRVLTLLERAAAFRQAYSDNPYVTVAGFEISLSLTGPTLGMSFEFKE
jgi:hypothetical protein